MYTRNILNKILQIKNIIFLIAGVFFLVGSIYVAISSTMIYKEDEYLLGGALILLIFAVILIIVAIISNRWIGDANYYSAFFEGDLDGRVKLCDLALLMGKPVWAVGLQLKFFRFLYMKGFGFEKVKGQTEIILDSRKIICQCNECGGEIEKSEYFTGKCSYCGGLDLHAKVLMGDQFYSVENDISKGYDNPKYYQVPRLFGKKLLATIIAGIGALFVMVSIMGFADNLNSAIKTGDAELYDTAIVFAGIIIGFMPLIINGIKRFEYVHVVNTSSEYFANRKTPYVKLDSIPYVKKNANSKRRVRVLRRTVRKRYLRNCNFEIHNNQLMLVLSKQIVKNKCPYCGGAITVPVDEKYRCEYCDRIIMNVVKSK